MAKPFLKPAGVVPREISVQKVNIFSGLNSEAQCDLGIFYAYRL